jgi:serine/threonine protein kinase
LAGHPNIVRGIDYLPEEKRGLSYLVMEQVFGSSLLSYVQSQNSPIHDESLVKEIIS